MPGLRAGTHSYRPAFRHAVVLSGVAFLLHFTWESLQCRAFYVHGTYDATWRGMAVAALGDVVITWVVYGAVAAVSGLWRWSERPWRREQWLTMTAVAVTAAVVVEARALLTGRWSYKPGAPLIPATPISMIPVLQMLVLSPAAFAIAEALDPRGPGFRALWARLMRDRRP
jgi:hypothetical protein